MKKAKIIFAVALSIASVSVGAYELATHAGMTYHAYLRSQLNATFPWSAPSDRLLKNLGIDLMLIRLEGNDLWEEESPFGERYFDIKGSEIKEREANPFVVVK